MSIFIFFLEILVLFSAIFVVISTNPIHSIMFYILVVCGVSLYLITLQVEFLALVFLVVYVGAIAILFLFVVMMLNVRMEELTSRMVGAFSSGGIVVFIFMIIVLYSFTNPGFTGDGIISVGYYEWFRVINFSEDVRVLGFILFFYCPDLFILSGFILLIALIAAIWLTYEGRREYDRPHVFEQVMGLTHLRVYD